MEINFILRRYLVHFCCANLPIRFFWSCSRIHGPLIRLFWNNYINLLLPKAMIIQISLLILFSYNGNYLSPTSTICTVTTLVKKISNISRFPVTFDVWTARRLASWSPIHSCVLTSIRIPVPILVLGNFLYKSFTIGVIIARFFAIINYPFLTLAPFMRDWNSHFG